MYSGQDDVGQVWRDVDASRRFAAVSRRFALFVAAALVVVGSILAVASYRVIVAHERNSELSFAALVALAPRDGIEPLLAAGGREGIVIGEEGAIEVLAPGDRRNVQWERWRIRTRNAALVGDLTERFASTDPTAALWSHVPVAMPDGSTLVVSRPSNGTTALARQVTFLVSLATVVSLFGAGLVWLTVHRRVAVPLQELLDGGESLLVRGSIPPDIQSRFDRIAPVPLELSGLADAMRLIDEETEVSWRRRDALLSAARALGTSLDPDVVLATMLDHLHLLLGVDRSAIVQFDPRSEAMSPIVAKGHSGDYLSEISDRQSATASPSVRAARESVPVQVSDTEAEVVDARLRERARRHGFRSVLAVPLTSELDSPTVLLLHSTIERTYSYDEIEISKSFASIAGAALRNAELFSRVDQRLHAQTSRLQAIVESVDQGLLVGRSDGQLLFANTTMRALLPPEKRHRDFQQFGEFLDCVLNTAPSPAVAKANVLALDADTDRACDIELGNQRFGGPSWVRVRRFVVRDRRGTEIGFGQTWTDVARERELDAMKKDLLAAVSHEFRTPLALIKGYATTLLADDVEWQREDQEEFLRLVSHEADRLSSLVQRLLDMRRIDAGIVSLDLMDMPVSALVDAAAEGVLAPPERLDIANLPPVVVECDPARVVTAVRNLLENACEYSPDDSLVTISGRSVDGAVELSIRDRGPGIPPERRDEIFETFVRGESGLTAEHGGTGLGLSIARGFIVAHGGAVWADSPADGGPGAVLRVRLPLTPVLAADREELT